MIGDVSRNKREKYSEIRITWWEDVVLPFDESKYGTSNRSFRWWLEDSVSFDVGEDRIHIPVESQGDDFKVVSKGFYRARDRAAEIGTTNWYLNNFLVKGDYTSPGSSRFLVFIFGQEDNILINGDEFSDAGGSATLEWNPEEYIYEVVIQPPHSAIGVNKSFSTTLEGSVPGIYIQGDGAMLQKRVSTFYTEFYGKVHNVLEHEFEYITSADQLYRAAQKLLEKYSFGNTTLNLNYWEHDSGVLDNKNIVPQSVSVDSTGKYSTNNAFIYNRLDSIAGKPLQELGSLDFNLEDVQFYPLAFLS